MGVSRICVGTEYGKSRVGSLAEREVHWEACLSLSNGSCVAKMLFGEGEDTTANT